MQIEDKLALIQVALDMLDSIESTISTKEVEVQNEVTYAMEKENQVIVSQVSTFRGEERQKIKDWLLTQVIG